MNELPPLPMDQAELRTAALKLLTIDEAGLLSALRAALADATKRSQGGHHDGTRYWPVALTEYGQNEQDLFHMRNDKLVAFRLGIVGMAEEFLQVPRWQAEAAAIEIHMRTRRAVALELIDEFHKQARKKLAMQHRGRRAG